MAARWQNGDAEDCKSLNAGSIPARASTNSPGSVRTGGVCFSSVFSSLFRAKMGLPCWICKYLRLCRYSKKMRYYGASPTQVFRALGALTMMEAMGVRPAPVIFTPPTMGVALYRPYFPMAAAPVFTNPVIMRPAIMVAPVSAGTAVRAAFGIAAGAAIIGGIGRALRNLFSHDETPSVGRRGGGVHVSHTESPSLPVTAAHEAEPTVVTSAAGDGGIDTSSLAVAATAAQDTAPAEPDQEPTRMAMLQRPPSPMG